MVCGSPPEGSAGWTVRLIAAGQVGDLPHLGVQDCLENLSAMFIWAGEV